MRVSDAQHRLGATPVDWIAEVRGAVRGAVGQLRFAPSGALVLAVAAAWLHGLTVGVARVGDGAAATQFLLSSIAVLVPVSLVWRGGRVKRLCVAFLFFLATSFVMSLSAAVAWERHPAAAPVLPDLVHGLIGPPLETTTVWGVTINWTHAPDVCIALTVASTLVLVATHPHAMAILRRFLTVYALLMLFRSVTIVVTSLPDPAPKCVHQTEGPKDLRESAPLRARQRRGSRASPSPAPRAALAARRPRRCRRPRRRSHRRAGSEVAGSDRALHVRGPGVFRCVAARHAAAARGAHRRAAAGHTMALVMCGLCWHTYYEVRPGVWEINPRKVVVWVIVGIGLFFIIATRLHYTIDVLLAVYLTLTIWCARPPRAPPPPVSRALRCRASYHRLAYDLQIGAQFWAIAVVDGALLYPAVQWLEQGAPPVPSAAALRPRPPPVTEPKGIRADGGATGEAVGETGGEAGAAAAAGRRRTPQRRSRRASPARRK